MIHIDSTKIALGLLNDTLALEDLPMEIHGRIATALVLLDRQDGEDFYIALRDAYSYMEQTGSELERLLEEWTNDQA